MSCEGSRLQNGGLTLLLISLPADSTTIATTNITIPPDNRKQNSRHYPACPGNLFLVLPFPSCPTRSGISCIRNVLPASVKCSSMRWEADMSLIRVRDHFIDINKMIGNSIDCPNLLSHFAISSLKEGLVLCKMCMILWYVQIMHICHLPGILRHYQCF